MEISNRNLGQEIAKIICHHFVTLVAYQHVTFICLSESYLDTMIPSDHISLDLEGYKLVCADHPSNVKQGGICMYYKEPLPVRVINLPYHQEALPL